jgi:hypothetical protein
LLYNGKSQNHSAEHWLWAEWAVYMVSTGSERVGKSHAKGKQLAEAKHINLSLHYLEMVIVSLQHVRGR